MEKNSTYHFYSFCLKGISKIITADVIPWDYRVTRNSRDCSQLFIRPERQCAFEFGFVAETRRLSSNNCHIFTALKIILRQKTTFTRKRWSRFNLRGFSQYKNLSRARAKTVEHFTLSKLLPLKRQRPISPHNLGPFSFSFSPKNSALSHCIRTGCGLSDTASACLIYFLPLGWPSYMHKLQTRARDISRNQPEVTKGRQAVT